MLTICLSLLLTVALDETLPNFFAGGVTTPNKVLVVLEAQEANARFFLNLKGEYRDSVHRVCLSRSPPCDSKC